MANIYPDIAIRPDITGHPLVNQQTSGIPTNDSRDSADFKRFFDKAAENSAGGKNSATAASAGSTSFTGFIKNLFDIINPLQHIPIVSAIYRHITGDQINPGAHFIGDALYGGPIGGILAAANIAYQKKTGRDVGETVIAGLTGHGKMPAASTAPDTMIAQNLSQISPAAGGPTASPSKNKIIWSDNGGDNIIQASESPLFPPSLPTGTIGEGPASSSTSAPPVLQTKGAVSTTVLQPQEAPAGAARKSASPELIASKMMEGLEKYAAMKQGSLAPNISALY